MGTTHSHTHKAGAASTAPDTTLHGNDTLSAAAATLGTRGVDADDANPVRFVAVRGEAHASPAVLVRRVSTSASDGSDDTSSSSSSSSSRSSSRASSMRDGSPLAALLDDEGDSEAGRGASGGLQGPDKAAVLSARGSGTGRDSPDQEHPHQSSRGHALVPALSPGGPVHGHLPSLSHAARSMPDIPIYKAASGSNSSSSSNMHVQHHHWHGPDVQHTSPQHGRGAYASHHVGLHHSASAAGPAAAAFASAAQLESLPAWLASLSTVMAASAFAAEGINIPSLLAHHSSTAADAAAVAASSSSSSSSSISSPTSATGGASSDPFALLVESLQRRHYPQGAYIVHRGEVAEGLFLIEDGDAEMVVRTRVRKSGDKAGSSGRGAEQGGATGLVRSSSAYTGMSSSSSTVTGAVVGSADASSESDANSHGHDGGITDRSSGDDLNDDDDDDDDDEDTGGIGSGSGGGRRRGVTRMRARLFAGSHFGENYLLHAQHNQKYDVSIIARSAGGVIVRLLTRAAYESLLARDVRYATVLASLEAETKALKARRKAGATRRASLQPSAVRFVSAGAAQAKVTKGARLGKAEVVSGAGGNPLSAAASSASLLPTARSTMSGAFTTTSLAAKYGASGNFRTLNSYLLLRKLGSGSYGKVYLAVDTAHPRADIAISAILGGSAPPPSAASCVFAVKVVDKMKLRRRLLGVSDAVLLREVEVMKRLRHINLIRLHEVVDDPTAHTLYLVQEYCSFGPVMTDAEWHNPLPLPVARSYFRDVLCGLEYLHFQRVIHRDIKPSNILINELGRAKLGDFGVSYVLKEDEPDLLTEVAGSPAFMGPELFADSPRYSGRAADIYALGATLYCLVVGRPPFLADSEREMVALVCSPLEAWIPSHFSPALRHLLRRLLAKNPSDRPTLPEIMRHEWVTNEGAEPLPRTTYVRISLAAVHGVSADGTGGTGGEGSGSATGDDSGEEDAEAEALRQRVRHMHSLRKQSSLGVSSTLHSVSHSVSHSISHSHAHGLSLALSVSDGLAAAAAAVATTPGGSSILGPSPVPGLASPFVVQQTRSRRPSLTAAGPAALHSQVQSAASLLLAGDPGALAAPIPSHRTSVTDSVHHSVSFGSSPTTTSTVTAVTAGTGPTALDARYHVHHAASSAAVVHSTGAAAVAAPLLPTAAAAASTHGSGWMHHPWSLLGGHKVGDTHADAGAHAAAAPPLAAPAPVAPPATGGSPSLGPRSRQRRASMPMALSLPLHTLSAGNTPEKSNAAVGASGLLASPTTAGGSADAAISGRSGGRRSSMSHSNTAVMLKVAAAGMGGSDSGVAPLHSAAVTPVTTIGAGRSAQANNSSRNQGDTLVHLAYLRKRQLALLKGHAASLPASVRDALMDQQRMAIHQARAEATVEEIELLQPAPSSGSNSNSQHKVKDLTHAGQHTRDALATATAPEASKAATESVTAAAPVPVYPQLVQALQPLLNPARPEYVDLSAVADILLVGTYYNGGDAASASSSAAAIASGLRLRLSSRRDLAAASAAPSSPSVAGTHELERTISRGGFSEEAWSEGDADSAIVVDEDDLYSAFPAPPTAAAAAAAAAPSSDSVPASPSSLLNPTTTAARDSTTSAATSNSEGGGEARDASLAGPATVTGSSRARRYLKSKRSGTLRPTASGLTTTSSSNVSDAYERRAPTAPGAPVLLRAAALPLQWPAPEAILAQPPSTLVLLLPHLLPPGARARLLLVQLQLRLRLGGPASQPKLLLVPLYAAAAAQITGTQLLQALAPMHCMHLLLAALTHILQGPHPGTLPTSAASSVAAPPAAAPTRVVSAGGRTVRRTSVVGNEASIQRHPLLPESEAEHAATTAAVTDITVDSPAEAATGLAVMHAHSHAHAHDHAAGHKHHHVLAAAQEGQSTAASPSADLTSTHPHSLPMLRYTASFKDTGTLSRAEHPHPQDRQRSQLPVATARDRSTAAAATSGTGSAAQITMSVSDQLQLVAASNVPLLLPTVVLPPPPSGPLSRQASYSSSSSNSEGGTVHAAASNSSLQSPSALAPGSMPPGASVPPSTSSAGSGGSSASSGSRGVHRTASGHAIAAVDDDQFKGRTLRRQKDFVMVTEAVQVRTRAKQGGKHGSLQHMGGSGSGDGDGEGEDGSGNGNGGLAGNDGDDGSGLNDSIMIKKAVMFRAKGDDGSLSIANAMRGLHSAPPKAPPQKVLSADAEALRVMRGMKRAGSGGRNALRVRGASSAASGDITTHDSSGAQHHPESEGEDDASSLSSSLLSAVVDDSDDDTDEHGSTDGGSKMQKQQQKRGGAITLTDVSGNLDAVLDELCAPRAADEDPDLEPLQPLPAELSTGATHAELIQAIERMEHDSALQPAAAVPSFVPHMARGRGSRSSSLGASSSSGSQPLSREGSQVSLGGASYISSSAGTSPISSAPASEDEGRGGSAVKGGNKGNDKIKGKEKNNGKKKKKGKLSFLAPLFHFGHKHKEELPEDVISARHRHHDHHHHHQHHGHGAHHQHHHHHAAAPLVHIPPPAPYSCHATPESCYAPLRICFGVSEEQGKRSTMEDRTMVLLDLAAALPTPAAEAAGLPDGSAAAFFAVYDGHNGDACASYLARKLHLNVLREPCFATDAASALTQGFLITDHLFIKKQLEQEKRATESMAAHLAALHGGSAGGAGGMPLPPPMPPPMPLMVHLRGGQVIADTGSATSAMSPDLSPPLDLTTVPAPSLGLELAPPPAPALSPSPALSPAASLASVPAAAPLFPPAPPTPPAEFHFSGATAAVVLLRREWLSDVDVASASAASASAGQQDAEEGGPDAPATGRPATDRLHTHHSSPTGLLSATHEVLRVYVAHAGDCRVVACVSGVAEDLTTDHKCSREDEAARIEAAGGWIHRGRLHGVLAVSRAFGDAEHKVLKERFWEKQFVSDPLIADPEIHILTLPLPPAAAAAATVPSIPAALAGGIRYEFLILACDGIFDVLSSQQAVNFVRRRLAATGGDVQAAACDLVAKALERGSVDNCSAIVLALPSVTATM